MKPLADIGDPAAPIGSVEWCKYIHGIMCQTKRRANAEVSSLKYTLIEFKKSKHWERLTDAGGHSFMAWQDYVQYPEPDGLGMAVADAEAIISEKNDKRLIADIRAARAHELDANAPDLLAPHRPKKRSDKESVATLNGRGSEYAIARLRKDRPDIHARVLAGEITPHAGMVEAGFRKKAVRKKRGAFERTAKSVAKLSDDDWQRLKRQEDQRRQSTKVAA